MSAPLLTDEQINATARNAQIRFCLKSGGSFEEEYARAIESAVRAPLLAEIERLTAALQREREARQSAQIGIELLQAQIARLEPMRQRADDIKRLTAERDAAMADAERYRWLCSYSIHLSPSLWQTGVGFAAIPLARTNNGRTDKAALDAAIDAARSAT